MKWVRQQVVRLHRWMLRLGFAPDWFLIPIAALIGCIAALAAQGYGRLVRASEGFFYGTLAHHNLSGRSIWLVLALPVLGGAIVGMIKSLFRLPMISHGIPEVVEAMARQGGRLPKRMGVFTAINSAIILGSGGSVGQEGPIVMIGSVVGSTISRWIGVGRKYMSTLVGCGGAAGLAAIFNAPISGVLLVLEVVLRDFSPKTFTPVIVASVFAVAVNQTITDRSDALFHPVEMTGHSFHVTQILPYLLLGLASGLTSWALAKTLYAMEHLWLGIKRIPLAAKPMLGAFCLGLMGLLVVILYPLISSSGRSPVPGYAPPPFFGNGYPVIEALLDAKSYDPGSTNGLALMGFWFLLCILIGKVLGTSLSLGSGGSGGLFAPCLFIGAALGGLLGVCFHRVGLVPHSSPAAFALAGMAGVLSGALRCPLTAIILTFEITRDYQVILPVMIVAITAMSVSQLLMRESIYELALKERGLRVGTRADLTVLRRLHVGATPLTRAVTVRADEPAQRLVELAQNNAVGDYVVTRSDGQYVGLVPAEALRQALLAPESLPLMVVGDLMQSGLPTLSEEDTLDVALDRFSEFEISSLAVVDRDNLVKGMLTRARLMRDYHQALGE